MTTCGYKSELSLFWYREESKLTHHIKVMPAALQEDADVINCPINNRLFCIIECKREWQAYNEEEAFWIYTFCVKDLNHYAFLENERAELCNSTYACSLEEENRNKSQEYFKTDSRVHKISPFPTKLTGK